MRIVQLVNLFCIINYNTTCLSINIFELTSLVDGKRVTTRPGWNSKKKKKTNYLPIKSNDFNIKYLNLTKSLVPLWSGLNW